MDWLRPDNPEIGGALVMMLLTDARRDARTDTEGASVSPSRQDGSLWNQSRNAEDRAVLQRAVGRGRAGPFQIKAAVADCHMADVGSDWPQIVALYGALWRFQPTPVVLLNAAVAVAEAGDPVRGLSMVNGLSGQLSD